MQNENRNFVSAWLSIVFSILLTYFICILITKEVPGDFFKNVEILFSVNASAFAPEPLERLRFIISIVCFPILLAVFYLLFNKLLSRLTTDYSFKIPYYSLYAITMIITMTLLNIYSKKSENKFFIDNNFINNFPFVSGVLLIILSSVVYICYKSSFRKIVSVFMQHKKNGINKIMFSVMILFILFVSATNIYSIYSIDDGGRYTSHLNAVFHSIALVHMGESLLVDLLNQYGLYPHFLEIIFSLIGLNVLKFTIVMSVFIFLGFFLLYKVLDELIDNKIFAILGFSVVLYYGYVHFKLVTIDSYFQYYPIRTTFPILLIYCSMKYFKNKTPLKYYLFTILFSTAVLWNQDTGIVVLFTWLIVLIFEEVLIRKGIIPVFKYSLIHIINIFISLIIIVSLFVLFIFLRTGTIPDILDTLRYQVYFYGYGFYMLPMKLFHPWNLVALIYIIGLCVSFKSIYAKENSLMAKMIFLLSILGVGLSSYYQGRSHDLVLTLVWYPSLILIALFTYNLYQKILSETNTNQRENWLHRFVFLGLVIISTSSLLSLLENSKTIYVLTEGNISKMIQKKETPVTSGLEFIKKNMDRNEKGLILSYHSGIDYLYSQTVPRIGMPGTSELFLNKDYDRIYGMIEVSSLNKVFLDKNFITDTQMNYKANIKVLELLYKNFDIVDRNEFDNILLLKRKESHILPSFNKILVPDDNVYLHYFVYDDFYVIDSLTNVPIGSKDNLPSIKLNQQFTIEIVVKPYSVQSPYASILGNHPGKGMQGFVIQQDNNYQNMYTFTFGDGKEWSTPLKIQLEPDKWSLLAISYDMGQINIYNNGELISSINSSLSQFENSEMPLSIGNWINKDREFSGEIKEIFISNDILPKEVILKHWELMNIR